MSTRPYTLFPYTTLFRSFLLLPIDLVFSITGNNTNGYVDPYDRYDEPTRLVVLAVSSVLLTIRILFGLFGNALRARKLRRLGFSHIGRVKADGKAHAISLCKDRKSTRLNSSH